MEKKTFRQRVSKVVRGIYTNYLKYVKKVDIGKGVSISQRIDMDKVNPRGIHIGDETGCRLGLCYWLMIILGVKIKLIHI